MTKFEKIQYVLKNVPHIIKSVCFCVRVLPWKQAVRVPIIVRCGVKMHIRRGDIILDSDELRPFFIRIGMEGSKGVPSSHKGYINVQKGKIVIHGELSLGKGITIRVEDGATVDFGNHTHLNSNTFILSRHGVIFGEDVLFGWNIMVLDDDGHEILYDGVECTKSDGRIYIGNHVWIGADSKIFKGTYIGDGSVVASGSLVNKKFEESNLLICGSPAVCKRREYTWIN